jgi:large subunit ribosomal protein L15
MKEGELKPKEGSKKDRKRVGRGKSSGRGNKCGRGTKGLLSRSGGKVRRGFEGGQTPLFQRIAKRGFTPHNKTVYEVVNVESLSIFRANTEVDIEKMKASGLVKGREIRVKVLGSGEIEKALKVKANAFSKSAREKIEKAGGSTEVI